MSIERSKLVEATFGYNQDFDTKKQSQEWVMSVIENPEDLLPNTSFDIPFNITQYLNRTSLEGYLSLTRADVEGYVQEFTLGDPVIPYEVSLGLNNGKPEVMTEHYVTHEIVPLLSLLDPRERGGAVVRRTELLSKLLSAAQPGDTFLSTSPDGWHGMSEEGQLETQYNHTQTTLYKVLQGGKIEAYTVRSSMDLAQNEELLKHTSNGEYSPYEDSNDTKARIIDVVDTVIKSPQVRSVDELVQKIAHLRGDSPFWVNRKYTGELMRVWNSQEVISAFKNRQLNPVSNEISPAFAKFKALVGANIKGDSVDEVRLLAHYLKNLVLESSFAARVDSLPEGTKYDVSREASYNEGLAGCVGSVYSEFGPRSVEEEYSFDKWDWCKCCSTETTKVYKWVGPCQICEKCDSLLRQGLTPKKVEDVKVDDTPLPTNPFGSESVTSGIIQLIATAVRSN